MTLWLWLLVAVGVGVARSLPRVQLTATLRPDLQTITGEIVVTDGAPLQWSDVLSQLPDPEDDLTAHRTWPYGAEKGLVHIAPVDEGRWSFYAILPRRYGAAGMVPGHGVFANGLWHPQPMRGDQAATVQWDARITLPPGAAGALNDAFGEQVLEWSGEAERLSLAAIPDGQIRVLTTKSGFIEILDRKKRPKFDRRLKAILSERWPQPGVGAVRVIVAPLRRRLTRPGPGVVYLSDRTFRVSGRLWKYHAQSVRLGVLSSHLPITDPWLRQLAAAAQLDAEQHPPELTDALGWVSWIPEIDDVIYNGQLPFFSDVFDEAWPGDVLADDLQEVVRRQSPGRAMVARIDAIYGDGATGRLTDTLLAGRSLHAATVAAGVPPIVLEEWRAWPESQDLSLDVQALSDQTWRIEVTRQAEDGAPMEPVIVEINGIGRRLNLGPGPDQSAIVQPFKPERVQVDPDRLLNQTTRANDRWPNRWTTVVAFIPTELSVQQARFSGSLSFGFRKQYDTRWLYGTSLYTDPQNRVGGTVSALRYIGPLLDRRYRPVRIWGGVGTALLDPAFRSTDAGATAIEVFGGASWDTRMVNSLARSGHRLSVTGSAGRVPESTEQWASSQLTALQLVPLTGRLTLGARARGGVSTGDVEHRLYNLGGSGAVQGLPFDDATLGNLRGVGSVELRWMAVRNASVPFPLFWASDMQVSLGLDGGAVERWSDNTRDQALGWSLGLGFMADLLGADPNFGGVWLAGPIAPETTDSLSDVQLYVRFSQAF
ncbi:MAG: hypothetical protein AAFV53_36955 [Myxococcota bacterium]